MTKRNILPLSSGLKNSQASSLAVTGTNVYVAASDGKFAAYWKDGVETKLPSTGKGEGIGNAITIFNGDVYIGGSDSTFAVYWKNGTEVFLPRSAPGSGTVTSIVVSGGSVYAAGSDGTFPAYWKDGVETKLPSDGISAYASSTAVTSSDVYVCGIDATDNYSNAVYWKNGVKTNLTTNTQTFSSGNAIAVFDADVIVAGADNNTAVYWKNGVKTTLASTIGFNPSASALFLAKR